eukprot:CAMPEP_0116935162 /NCGR_PEP_ID=MMETSP0467-20121206/30099_1 /TAXON_ID=283647 /ORGANISM="Mesodinium pulex, Strain SPMC105" /LENGTH=119 /DNA_ID=CAMNT_0004616443 /DNA_START=245 /DNA_END=604 /DNA_ORIENTATION=+
MKNLKKNKVDEDLSNKGTRQRECMTPGPNLPNVPKKKVTLRSKILGLKKMCIKTVREDVQNNYYNQIPIRSKTPFQPKTIDFRILTKNKELMRKNIVIKQDKAKDDIQLQVPAQMPLHP